LFLVTDLAQFNFLLVPFLSSYFCSLLRYYYSELLQRKTNERMNELNQSSNYRTESNDFYQREPTITILDSILLYHTVMRETREGREEAIAECSHYLPAEPNKDDGEVLLTLLYTTEVLSEYLDAVAETEAEGKSREFIFSIFF